MSDERDLFGDPMTAPTTLHHGAYPHLPGTGPAGETCRTCNNATLHTIPSGSRFWKCALVKATGGPGTDIRLKTPACRAWVRHDE